jgi:hypothetical protein
MLVVADKFSWYGEWRRGGRGVVMRLILEILNMFLMIIPSSCTSRGRDGEMQRCDTSRLTQ